EHAPTGPLNDLTGIEFYGNGQRLTWARDLEEMFTLHVNVPASVSTLEARVDLVLSAPPEGFSSGASATAQLDMVSWNQMVLYPPGKHSDDIPITASLRIPAGWHYGTALPVDNEGSNRSPHPSGFPPAGTMEQLYRLTTKEADRSTSVQFL